ncbi:hypothetical protein FJ987_21165 [Mesorhizobium sp. CU2]|uniref:hypothetical protein n=1 Tax=unclassified Mesorhizobium TaxID=325217 RepID=UPI00112A2960|nr:MULTISPECIES: hypothetical protein [unclassified Mesorhizobium]TPN88337.1 hypothetical protein FJ988_04630 [Mesorhizobium sp. CU3]TPO10315.1 hypothetical protein FJ987_21165 [Mesorhizobium sp. CU2]
MDPSTAAVMVLLNCNQATSHCQPSRTEPVVYSSIADCHEALRARLATWPHGEMVGRCKQVDTTATGSVPEGYKAVQVTRGIGDGANTTTYFVLKSGD